MPDTFGIAYLDADTFRGSAELFGVGMALVDYPGPPADDKLAKVLQAASRAVDVYCGRDFNTSDRVETQELDLETWQFQVNNPPVTAISSCAVRYAIDGTLTIPTGNIFINNQRGYCEITRAFVNSILLGEIGSELAQIVVEITYKSLQDVPSTVKLATGYQASHMINNGFVDKILPPNFGSINFTGLSLNNRKGARQAPAVAALSFSPEAERLLTPYKRIAVG